VGCFLSRRTLVGRLAWATGAVLLAGCGPDAVVVPAPPPGLEQLVAIYDNPTGTVPVEDVSMAMAEARSRFEALEEGRLPDVVADLAARARSRLDTADLSHDPDETPDEDSSADTDGYLNINRTCAGWDAQATVPDAPSNGTLTATATFENAKLDRALWATATSCRDRVPFNGRLQVNVFLDGKLGIYLEDELPQSINDARMLVGFEGTIGSDQRQRPLSFDFRINFPRIEVRVPVADGDIIAEVGGGDHLVLRGSNGSFTCSIQDGDCGGPQ
jgi:hypothetical protein